MKIYFRACEKQQTISNVTRFHNYNKDIILKKCWLSIQKSIKTTDEVYLILDSVSKNTTDWLISTAKTKTSIVEVPEHEWSYHQHTVTLVEHLEAMSKLYPSELHYIVEDDYLHTHNALDVLRDTLEEWSGFAVPYDYIDRYINAVPSKIFLGLDRHWRTIDSSTMTVLAKGALWIEAVNALKQAAPTSNDKVFEFLYTKVPCISPIPGVATHLTDRHFTPFVNWDEVWDSINV